jgi:hypothetical protein
VIASTAMPGSKSLRRRALRVALVGALVGGAVGVAALRNGGEAQAAVSILMTMDELVAHSRRVVVAQPVERTSRWENLGGGRRIVTYTRLAVEETIAGEARPEIWVRTLGGTVDKIGQHVSGEAAFTLGERSMVFVEEVEGVAVVTGMAQGHYRLKDVAGKVVLRPSPDAGTLLPRRGPSIAARELLVDAPLDRARAVVVDAWKRRGSGK